MRAGGAEFSERWLEPVDDVDVVVRCLLLDWRSYRHPVIMGGP